MLYIVESFATDLDQDATAICPTPTASIGVSLTAGPDSLSLSDDPIVPFKKRLAVQQCAKTFAGVPLHSGEG
jgi:hypothetical protein